MPRHKQVVMADMAAAGKTSSNMPHAMKRFACMLQHVQQVVRAARHATAVLICSFWFL